MPYFEFKGKNVYYEVDGVGPYLVILNGIMMSTKSWEPFLNSLSSNHTLIRVDFLDQGQSSKMEESYKIADQCELLLNLIKNLKIKKFDLVGISYGGQVAIDFAVKHQKYLNRLVIFNSVAYTTSHVLELLTKWRDLASQRDAKGFYDVCMSSIYSHVFTKKEQVWMDNRKDILINGPFSDVGFLDSMIRLIDSTIKFDQRANLGKIEVPTLVVGADLDTLMPLGNQHHLASLIPNASMVVIPSCGHASMYESPVAFCSLILGFLATKDVKYKL